MNKKYNNKSHEKLQDAYRKQFQTKLGENVGLNFKYSTNENEIVIRIINECTHQRLKKR